MCVEGRGGVILGQTSQLQPVGPQRGRTVTGPAGTGAETRYGPGGPGAGISQKPQL